MIKRSIDILLSLLALIVFFPLLFFLALLIYFNMGGPILFKQARPGLRGEVFSLLKFRSMKDIKDKSGKILPDEERITKLGLFLRNYSLDELPSLWNIFIGDMSIVGPRPLLVEYLERYNEEQAKRHDVKPGLTGWAQVNGRNAISWEEKFNLDIWYVEHQSLILDIKIILLTIKKVFIKEGISADNHATMPEFKGTKDE